MLTQYDRSDRERWIKDMVFKKINDGWTVRRLKDGRYEFKKKTSLFDGVEKFHSPEFLTNFLNYKK